MVFDQPVYLFLFVFLPLGIYFYHFWNKRGGRILLPIVDWPGEKLRISQYFIVLLVLIGNLAFWIGFSTLIIALAGPMEVEKVKVYSSRGLDIMLVVDQSPSMAIKDVRLGDVEDENRLDSAKRVLSDFVKSRENDSIGLISFGTNAFVRVAPTVDYSSLLREIDDIKLLEAGKSSAIGVGIASACRFLRDSSAEEKIIILITDGNNIGGDIQPMTAAEISASLGIKIYSIGIGTNSTESFSYRDGDYIVEAVADANFNRELLEKISMVSGGKFIPVTNYTTFEKSFEIIDSLESVKSDYVIKNITRPIHRRFLVASLILVFSSIFIFKVVLLEVF
ncbi:MAG: VWA domain-containing protein [Spirochaetales bacterium]|nr:VWA domain-containing protein [Spirochaetales bacterium]